MLFLGSCQTGDPLGKYEPAQVRLHQELVLDVEPLSENPTILQIAQSLPICDFPWEDFPNTAPKDCSDTEYHLPGDGAQSSAVVKLLRQEAPMLIKLEYGPHFDGFGFRMPIEHYTFERVADGWKRLDFNVTYHGSAKLDGTYEPSLSDKENRKKIEQITGNPYGYHWGRMTKLQKFIHKTGIRS
jgi:hypothetical protein